MPTHILTNVKVATMNRSKNDEFAKMGRLTEILNRQTVFNGNRNMAQVFKEPTKGEGALHLGGMKQRCR